MPYVNKRLKIGAELRFGNGSVAKITDIQVQYEGFPEPGIMHIYPQIWVEKDGETFVWEANALTKAIAHVEVTDA